MKSLGHIRALDGLRAIAVLLVLGDHAALPGFFRGRAGVFTLSFAAAWVSYAVVEGPFLAMKRRWEPKRPVVNDAANSASTSTPTAAPKSFRTSSTTAIAARMSVTMKPQIVFTSVLAFWATFVSDPAASAPGTVGIPAP